MALNCYFFATELRMKTKFVSVTLLCFLPVAAAAQSADEIVKKALEARGGVAKLKSVQSERITGRITFAHGEEGVFVVELKRPLKMHVEISVEGQKIIRVYDGKSSGWMINPFLETKDAQPMAPEDLKNISDESDFDGPLVDYKSKGNQIELAGKESLDDKPVYRLKLTNKNGEVRFYFLDAASFLLVKWEGVRRTGDQDVPWESYFSDFQEVHGLRFPSRIDQGSPGTEVKQTLTAEKIEIDPQIDDSRFAKPVPADPPAAPAPPAPPAPSAPPVPNPPRP
jgi:outer membrane lipoprotein-sorting protein